MSDSAADLRRIEEILRRIETAENAGDSVGLAELLAEDAVIMAPNQPVQEGKAACAVFVRNILADQLENFERRITYVSAEVRVFGDHAFDRGGFSFTVAPKSGGETSHATGKYMFLYSRAGDDSWKLARAIVNLDAPDEEAT